MLNSENSNFFTIFNILLPIELLSYEINKVELEEEK